MAQKIKVVLLLAGLTFLPRHEILAQNNVLQIGIIERTPFVVKQGTGFIGYSIELWDSVAALNNWEYETVLFTQFSEMLAAAAKGEVDVAVANISVTAEREKIMDYSYPIYNAGLQLLISTQRQADPNLWDILLASGLFQAIIYATGLLILVAHLIWFFERHNDEAGFHQDYLRGVFDGIWWAAVTITTVGYGDRSPKSVAGRVIGFFWALSSLFLLALFVGQISSALSASRLTSDINGPDDLKGHVVTTIGGSTAHDYLINQGISAILPVTNPEDLFQSVENGQADAAVFDAPILAFYAGNAGKGRVRLVGPIFQAEKFAFALPENSPHREAINQTLLSLREDGTIERISNAWFGDEN